MIQIDEELYGLNVEFHQTKKINYFFQNSGTGKSFFYEILQSYALLESKSCVVLKDSILESSIDLLVSLCQNKEIIIVDSLDLIQDKHKFLNSLLSMQAECIIIDTKSLYNLPMKNVSICRVEYKDEKIVILQKECV